MANTTDVMNNPSIVEVGSWTFIIMDAPNDANLHLYLKICQEKKVTDIVRCCEKTYNTDPCTQAGIDVHDFEFDDGGQAPDEILAKWIDLLNTRNKASPSVSIAVHCIAGLGRAPLLAAIALVEKCGLDSQAAVTLIRSKRRGAINSKQLKYLSTYSRSADAGCTCAIM